MKKKSEKDFDTLSESITKEKVEEMSKITKGKKVNDLSEKDAKKLVEWIGKITTNPCPH